MKSNFIAKICCFNSKFNISTWYEFFDKVLVHERLIDMDDLITLGVRSREAKLGPGPWLINQLFRCTRAHSMVWLNFFVNFHVKS